MFFLPPRLCPTVSLVPEPPFQGWTASKLQVKVMKLYCIILLECMGQDRMELYEPLHLENICESDLVHVNFTKN